MRLSIEIPEVADGAHRAAVEEAAREAAVLRLYADGVISAGRAAAELETELERFLKWASHRGIAVLLREFDDGELAAAARVVGPAA